MTMNIRRFFARPGVFTAAVACVVLVCAVLLWGAMSSTPVSRLEPAPASPAPKAEQAPIADATIARALLDMAGMANLAFEEPLAAPLEEGVKQVDFAFVQAMLRSNIHLDGAVIEKTELRQDATGPYTFQRVRLTVGGDPLPFVTNLYESLKAWAEDAELASATSGEDRDSAPSVWTVSVRGVVTHELALTHVLPPAPSAPPVVEGPQRILRRRDPGSPARLVIVMDDLGEDMNAVRALARLSFPVTFAVWPNSTHARKAAESGHAAGLEVIVHQPTEPMKYPEMNPGPRALFTSMTDRQIETRVRESLALVPHAVGMNNHMGSRFTRDRRSAAAMARPLQGGGLFILDSLTHPGSVLYAEARRQNVPALKRDIFLDSVLSKENVLRQLRKAENIAVVAGSAIAIGHPLPETLAALREWESKRDPQVELVRLSDLLQGK